MTAIWITLGIALLGFLPLLIILWKRKRIRKLKETGVLTTGVVENIEERIGFKGSRFFFVLIRYRAEGRQIEGTYRFTAYKNLPLFTKGAEIAIYYNPEKPGKFLPRDVPDNKGLLIFTIVFAIGYLVICYFLYGFLKENGL